MPKVLKAPTQGPLLSRLANSLNTACECKKKGTKLVDLCPQTYISDTPSIRSGFPRIRHIPVPSSPIIFDLGILLAYSTCNNQLKVRAYQADELSG